MLYSIYQIQSKLAQFSQYKNQKSDIMQFFTMANIFEQLKVNSAYTSDLHPPLFLAQKDIEKVCLMASHIFGVPFNYENFYEGKNALPKIDEHSIGLKKYEINNKEQLEKLIDEHSSTSSYGLKMQEKESQREIRKEKEAQLLEKRIAEKKAKEWAEFNAATNLKRDFSNAKIVSVDFEFFLKKNHGMNDHLVTEMGLTVREHGKINALHYLVEETHLLKKNKALQHKFHFGETKIVKLEELKKVLNEVLKNAHYVLFHEQREDFEILQSLGISLNAQVIDTQLCYKRYFRNKGSVPNGESLENLLDSLSIQYEDLHNAGNDSYYTLTLLDEMQNAVVNNEYQKSTKDSKKNKM